MITSLQAGNQTNWRSDHNAYIEVPAFTRGIKLLGGAELPLPPKVWPVGEGHGVAGVLYQPCLRSVEVEFSNYAGATLTDEKLAFGILKIDLSDLEAEPTWLPGAQPDPATVGGRYNVALESSLLDYDRGPWGRPADIGGGEFLDCFMGGGLLVPQFREANQVYAVALDGSGKAWTRQGWANYPSFLSTRSTEQIKEDIVELSSFGSAEYWRETYTALGIAGDRLIVERVRRYLSPQMAPDFIDGQLIWTVEGMTGGSPSEYRSYEMSGSFRAKWAWRSIGGINSTPSDHPVDIFRGEFTFHGGNPERFIDTSWGPSGPTSIANCLADALELAGRLTYQGHFVYNEQRFIESWDLATGATVASVEQPLKATLPEFFLQGVGTADVETYSASAIRGWPLHPEKRWAQPPQNPSGERTYYPPPTPKAGYVGGDWASRGQGPQVGLYYYADDSQNNLFPVMAGGPTITAALAPSGIYVRSSASASDPAWQELSGEDRPPIHVISCYSAIAPGDRAQASVALPWPFDPLSLATDGERIYFGPRSGSELAFYNTRQGRNLPSDAPNHTLPEWDNEVERVKRIVCWDALTLAPLWEIDALDHVASAVKPSFGVDLLHPCVGDREGNLIVLDARVLVLLHGGAEQKLLEIGRETGEVERATNLAETALNTTTNGIYLNSNLALCASENTRWCHDSLLALGNQLYGITPLGEIWKLQ